jgi:hypothetical protein
MLLGFLPSYFRVKLEIHIIYMHLSGHIGHPLFQVIYLRETKKLYLHRLGILCRTVHKWLAV